MLHQYMGASTSKVSSLYVVRPATMADQAAIRRLLIYSWRTYLPCGAHWLEQRLAAGDCWVMVERGQEIVGLIAVLRRHPEVISIVAAAVCNGLPATQYARMVLSCAESHARRQHVHRLACLSGAVWLNEALDAHGFQTCEHVITYGWDAVPFSVAGNSTVVVERARQGDLRTVAAIDNQIFAPVWHKPYEEIEYVLGRSAYFVVAKHRDRIIGYCWSEWDGTHGHLTRLGVTTDWQGKGVGTRLLTEALSEMVQAGINWVTLNTQASNLRARRLYERYGFRSIGQPTPLLWKELG